ncbi:hypothetical protein [Xanthobacter pseudotagetidis]|uniref:hypothetical protein n=1 Tax=Xanthobacter pseudotagetidis TaxID=3119911 RepID=UPI003728FF1B
MKVLPTARILLVDSQVERREATRQALTAFGVGAIVEASSFEDVQPPVGAGKVDVLVVQVDDADQVPENPYRDGGSVPAILVVEVAAPMVARSAGRAGYVPASGRRCSRACSTGGSARCSSARGVPPGLLYRWRSPRWRGSPKSAELRGKSPALSRRVVRGARCRPWSI